MLERKELGQRSEEQLCLELPLWSCSEPSTLKHYGFVTELSCEGCGREGSVLPFFACELCLSLLVPLLFYVCHRTPVCSILSFNRANRAILMINDLINP